MDLARAVRYVPDELDRVSADASAASMIYSFYGRLSVASTDVAKFRGSELPPTCFLYGSEEIFRSQIEACAEAVRQADVPAESRLLEWMQHGFGARGDWFTGFDAWLSPILEGHGSADDGAVETGEGLSFPLGSAINYPGSFIGTRTSRP